MKLLKLLQLCSLAFISSCDPVYDLHIINASDDTLFIRVNNYTDDRKKCSDYYPDSLTPYKQRQHIYTIPPSDYLKIGYRIGSGGPSEKDLLCDSLFIESKSLSIGARDKKTILKLIEHFDSEGDYEFIIR